MSALAAYQRGATGAGIGIAIIDSGIDLQSDEFAGRLSTASVDVAGNASIDDEGGHGTAVAFTAAGRRNGTGSHGVAYDATVIALRADRPGSCATAGTTDGGGCVFGTDAVARGLDAARAAGARVVNISLGSSEMPVALQQAVGRATAAGMVIVISAGNDGSANPDALAEIANAAVARNQVIIAGSVGSGDAISSFSNRAGTSAVHFLAAVGERVRAPDANNVAYLWSGTSFAAPQISGAVALLAQAFPNLTGAQIVDLLFRTARDAGTAGVDTTYGVGVLDLARAFQPVGTAVVAGSSSVVSGTGSTVLSAPMGDATAGPLGAVILDGYGRAFATDLARGIARAPATHGLGQALQLPGRSVALDGGGTTLALTISPRIGGVALETLRLRGDDAAGARVLAGMVTQRLGSSAAVAFGFRQGAAVLEARLAGRHAPAFLVADAEAPGFASASRQAAAARLQWQGFGLTAAMENGRVLPGRAERLPGESPQTSTFDRASLTVDRRLGMLSIALTGSRMAEENTVLGARFDAALGRPRATTLELAGSARVDLGSGWSAGGTWRRGWTRAELAGGMNGSGRLKTTAFAADVGKDGVFGRDSLGLRLAQPLRVAKGGIDYRLPTLWDYASASVSAWTDQRLNLAPRGRETDVEARYARDFSSRSAVQVNLLWRRDPGNRADQPGEYGTALRYMLSW